MKKEEKEEKRRGKNKKIRKKKYKKIEAWLAKKEKFDIFVYIEPWANIFVYIEPWALPGGGLSASVFINLLIHSAISVLQVMRLVNINELDDYSPLINAVKRSRP